MESKLLSGIYKRNKNSIRRVISGEEEVEEERGRLLHVILRFNNFHFIVHEDLTYLTTIITTHLATSNDKVESFAGVEQLFECIRPEKVEDRFDAGFIFVRREEIKLINVNLFPEDYYIVTVQRAEAAFLSLNEAARSISMDKLAYIQLAQKIVMEGKLFQYVVYHSRSKSEVEELAERFLETEFILEKVETEYSSEIIDLYYCELPRLTRLYLLCDEGELPHLLALLKIYAGFNPNFHPDSCKVLCVLSGILENDQLIMDHPNVTFLSHPLSGEDHWSILRYVHA